MSDPIPSPFFKNVGDVKGAEQTQPNEKPKIPTTDEMMVEAQGSIADDFAKLVPLLPPNLLELVQLALLRAYAHGATNAANRMLSFLPKGPEDEGGGLPVKKP